MPEHTTTQCVLFPGIFKRPVIAKFDQSQGSSDGGAVLLKAADRELGLITALAACLKDDRQEGKVRHEIDELLTQRIMDIYAQHVEREGSCCFGWLKIRNREYSQAEGRHELMTRAK